MLSLVIGQSRPESVIAEPNAEYTLRSNQATISELFICKAKQVLDTDITNKYDRVTG